MMYTDSIRSVLAMCKSCANFVDDATPKDSTEAVIVCTVRGKFYKDSRDCVAYTRMALKRYTTVAHSKEERG